MYLSPIDSAAHATWAAQLANYVDRATNCAAPIGGAGVAFRVDADGNVSDIRVTHASGDDKLDARAIARLRALGRLPAGPEGAAPRTCFAYVALPERVTGAVPDDHVWQTRAAAIETARRRAFA